MDTNFKRVRSWGSRTTLVGLLIRRSIGPSSRLYHVSTFFPYSCPQLTCSLFLHFLFLLFDPFLGLYPTSSCSFSCSSSSSSSSSPSPRRSTPLPGSSTLLTQRRQKGEGRQEERRKQRVIKQTHREFERWEGGTDELTEGRGDIDGGGGGAAVATER